MWNVKAATGVEDGPPARYTHGALWIGDRDQQVTTVLDQCANCASGEDGSDHRKVHSESDVAELVEGDAVRRIDCRMGIEPCAIGGVHRELPAHREEPQPSEHRQEDRGSKQHEAQPLENAAVSEREIDAKAPVQPSGDKQCELPSF